MIERQQRAHIGIIIVHYFETSDRNCTSSPERRIASAIFSSELWESPRPWHRGLGFLSRQICSISQPPAGIFPREESSAGLPPRPPWLQPPPSSSPSPVVSSPPRPSSPPSLSSAPPCPPA